jgi:hypothetical protein
MAGGKQTPRQRMIGILYLVLLGLIALNVPDSLLDAFKNITHSLDNSSGNVTTGIQSTYASFEATKLKDQHDRSLPIYNRAKEASKVAKALNDYVPNYWRCLKMQRSGRVSIFRLMRMRRNNLPALQRPGKKLILVTVYR